LHDLEKYWHELHEFAMTTQLGQLASMSGQQITLEDMCKKPDLMATLKAKKNGQPENCDTYEIPGDKRGNTVRVIDICSWQKPFLSTLNIS
jgi:hypothetical protein